MDISRIEESTGSGGIETLKAKNAQRRCLLYNEETCAAPHSRFEACRTCVRINEQVAVKNLFDRIKDLAANLLNLQAKGPEPPPPLSLFPG